MNVKKIAATLVSLFVAIWSAIYLVSAVWHVKQAILPGQEIGFGPHVMPWLEAIFMGARGVVGLLLAALLFSPSLHRRRWLILVVASLLAINLYNLHVIAQWMSEARYSNVSVFALFSSALLVEYCIEAIALVAGMVLLVVPGRRSQRSAG